MFSILMTVHIADAYIHNSDVISFFWRCHWASSKPKRICSSRKGLHKKRKRFICSIHLIPVRFSLSRPPLSDHIFLTDHHYLFLRILCCRIWNGSKKTGKKPTNISFTKRKRNRNDYVCDFGTLLLFCMWVCVCVYLSFESKKLFNIPLKRNLRVIIL